MFQKFQYILLQVFIFIIVILRKCKLIITPKINGLHDTSKTTLVCRKTMILLLLSYHKNRRKSRSFTLTLICKKAFFTSEITPILPFRYLSNKNTMNSIKLGPFSRHWFQEEKLWFLAETSKTVRILVVLLSLIICR